MSEDYVQVFKDETGEYRWRRRAGNHEIIADSAEGYTNHGDCLEMAQRVNEGCDLVDLSGRTLG